MKGQSSHKTVVIGSGKGGVGKSTVAVNLAVALAKTGLRVGLLDADVYGPSIPIMLGLRRVSPRVYSDAQGQTRVQPFTKFGVKSISIGFFLEESQSLVWRGPMLHGALQKMLVEVEWGELDLMLVDLPPGTGDIPISLAKLMRIDGAIVVCTPQEVAMLDAIKAINAFDQLNIPLLGVIENMAGFTAPDTGEVYHIFGQGKAQELATRFQVPLLGSIPLIPAIRRGSDEGYPAAFHQGDNDVGRHFRDLSSKVSQLLT
ncbi:MAG: Mrp/NBP35 family ATP-binding protein [Parachlamydiaceae bacterium]|nr:Mrp/NBP35 family ATP-binding protein [Parachlamydiaceae bacterium]